MSLGMKLARCLLCQKSLDLKFRPRIDNRMQDLLAIFDKRGFKQRKNELVATKKWYSKYGCPVKLEFGSVHAT